MNYYDIINQAIELVVVDAGNGLCFLEPRYKEALRIAGLLDHDEVISEEELIEAIKLEVEKRNIMNNKMNIIAAWIAKTIEEVIDPAITQEENDLMKNMLAYLERDKKAENKETEVKVKDNVETLKALNVNFAKRKAEE